LKPLTRGIVTPIITPFTADEELDLDQLGEHINFLINNDVNGIFPLGTSGEFALLSREERDQVLKKTVDEVNGRTPVWAGVSDPGTMNVVSNANRAVDIGVDAVVVSPPYYHRTNEEGIYTHYETIAEKIDIPIVIYNIPSATGHPINAKLAERLCEIDGIIAMKYTTNDLASFLSLLLVLKDRIPLFIGADALIYSALNIGAAGAVVGISNVIPRQTARIYKLYEGGDYAASRSAQMNIMPLVEVMFAGTFPAALKTALEMLNHNIWPVRKPLMGLTDPERMEVGRALREMNLIQ
jgi:4-hydroxy-tetrahydrodipicolinate synthase